MNKEILKLHAEFCKIFSNATRLEILCLLRSGEMTVSELIEKLGIPKSNTSQHLALMRMARILTTKKDGTNVYYGIANAKICQACSLMQEGLEQLYGDAPVIKRKGLSMCKEREYDRDSKKCIDHVLPRRALLGLQRVDDRAQPSAGRLEGHDVLRLARHQRGTQGEGEGS